MPKVQNYDRVYVVNKQQIDSSTPIGVSFPNGMSAFGESLTVPPGFTVSVIGNVNSGAAADIAAALVYYEDV